jgi:M6 family metalloprotease-like protein
VKILNRSFIVALFFGLILEEVQSAPAFPGITEIVQPNGAVVAARLKGDEWTHWIETLDGFSIAKSESGYWQYVRSYDEATPVLSGIRADHRPPLSLQRRIRPATKLPGAQRNTNKRAQTRLRVPGGKLKGSVLFILAEFTDRKGKYSQNSFADFLKNDIAHYFKKASNNRVKLTPAKETHGSKNNGVIGWINLGYRHPNTKGANARNGVLTRRAVIEADKYIDFKAYDKNDDGYTDADELAVIVIVAGYEAATTAKTPSVWGHAYYIPSPPKLDGVIVGAGRGNVMGYSQFGEIQVGATEHQATVGIMVHEIGHHIFGLPDLYDTDYSSDGIGAFCLMALGTWGQASTDTYAGQTPVLPSAWIRHTMGWVKTKPITRGRRTIRAAGRSTSGANTVYQSYGRLGGVSADEYFLVEYRNSSGYDKGLWAFLGNNTFGGIAIWHVDESMSDNSDDTHRLVDLEEADGDESAGSDTDFWYSGNSASGSKFSRNSTPDSKRYDGKSSGVCIKNFSAAGKKSIKASWGC